MTTDFISYERLVRVRWTSFVLPAVLSVAPLLPAHAAYNDCADIHAIHGEKIVVGGVGNSGKDLTAVERRRIPDAVRDNLARFDEVRKWNSKIV